MESFSTFGTRAPSSTSRLSQPRLDLKSECDIIMMHTGKEYLSIPRRVPIPTVPQLPHVVCHIDRVIPIPSSTNNSQPSPCSTPRLQRSEASQCLQEAEEDEAAELEEVEGLGSAEKTKNVVTSISTPV